jgi:hypothetical protein
VAPITRPKPTDATGIARAKEIKKNSDEIKRRSDELTTLASVEAHRLETEVFDPKKEDETIVIDEVVTLGAELADDSIIVRLVADIDSMTWGYGNDFTFKAGVKYKVPRDLANHLDSLGYLYTM